MRSAPTSSPSRGRATRPAPRPQRGRGAAAVSPWRGAWDHGKTAEGSAARPERPAAVLLPGGRTPVSTVGGASGPLRRPRAGTPSRPPRRRPTETARPHRRREANRPARPVVRGRKSVMRGPGSAGGSRSTRRRWLSDGSKTASTGHRPTSSVPCSVTTSGLWPSEGPGPVPLPVREDACRPPPPRRPTAGGPPSGQWLAVSGGGGRGGRIRWSVRPGTRGRAVRTRPGCPGGPPHRRRGP